MSLPLIHGVVVKKARSGALFQVPPKVWRSSEKQAEVVRRKRELEARGYPPAAVEQVVAEYYHPEQFDDLRRQDNVFVVMPSTTGENVLPRAFVERLQEDFGSEVILDAGRTTAKVAARKKRRLLERVSDPIHFAMTTDLSHAVGRHVVIVVDDIYTTGETAEQFRRALERQGISVQGSAVLAAGRVEAITPERLRTVAHHVAPLLGADYDTVVQILTDATRNFNRKWLDNAQREFRRLTAAELSEMFDHLVREAAAVRADRA